MNRLKSAVTATVIVATLALAGCAGSSPGSYDPAQTAADSDAVLKASLESAVTGLLGETGIPGAVFLVTRDGKELWSFAFNSPDQDALPVARRTRAPVRRNRTCRECRPGRAIRRSR